MSAPVEEVTFGVHVVTETDPRTFALKVGEAIGECSGGPSGPRPHVAISHTATDDGFNYLAIITGEKPNGEVNVIDRLNTPTTVS